tara:strand:- start:5065 stop:5487 length:423 start_codon:yes stop_codon:yes gene_type:complete
MQSQPSKKSPYKSLYGDLHVTPAAHLSELIFKRRSEVKNEGVLPQFFWRLPKYKKTFGLQMMYAARLLAKYDFDAILRGFNEKSVKNVLSFSNKRLLPFIEEAQGLVKDKAFVDKIVQDKMKLMPKKPFGKQNLWSRLNE